MKDQLALSWKEINGTADFTRARSHLTMVIIGLVSCLMCAFFALPVYRLARSSDDVMIVPIVMLVYVVICGGLLVWSFLTRTEAAVQFRDTVRASNRLYKLGQEADELLDRQTRIRKVLEASREGVIIRTALEMYGREGWLETAEQDLECVEARLKQIGLSQGAKLRSIHQMHPVKMEHGDQLRGFMENH